MLTLTIEIPALDRLCAILEGSDKSGLVAQIEDEIVRRLKKAAGDGTLEKAAETREQGTGNREQEKPGTPPPADVAKGEMVPTSSSTADAAPPAPTEEGPGKPATLADIQKAAAQMRDDGKLQAVKDLFPDFGIRKLSDLKADQLQTFAGKLREMGARI